MATVTSDRRELLSAERRFYSRMALFMVALMFVAFAPSFYLRDVVPSYPRPNPTLPPSVILHGIIFTMWMLVFVAQTQLVANRRVDIHMKLGKASMLLALVIIPMMYLVGVWQVARANVPPFTTPLDWTILPLSAIPVYAILVWIGWTRRKQATWHKRAMLGAAITVVAGPSIGRLPIAPPIFAGFAFQMLLGLALFVPLMLWDRRSIGHVHPATWLGFGLFAASVVVSVAAIGTGTWAPIAQHLPGV
jgi:hypothetical protein